MSLLGHIHSKTPIGVFDNNSSKVGFGLLGGVLPGGMGSPPTRGTTEFLKSYSEMPWLRAVAGRIATAVASIDWQLFVVKGTQKKQKADGSWYRPAILDGRVRQIQRTTNYKQRTALLKALDPDDLTEVFESPLLETLHCANAFQTGFGMRKLTQLHLDLTGDAFWLKERDAQGTVIAVWPIPGSWIMATPTPSFRNYRVSFRAWRGLIPDTEFLWFSDDDPLNPYVRGTGIARALTDELETDEYSAKYCHDENTECLTRRGWVRGPLLKDDDEIATWNEAAQRIEYQTPLGITRARYVGEMHYWRGDSVNACVTPTHRLWVCGKSYFGRDSLRRKGVCEWPRRGAFWHFEESQDAMRRPGRPFWWRDTGYYDGAQTIVDIPAVARVTKRKAGSRGGGRPPKCGVDHALTFDALAFAPFLGYYVSEGSHGGRGAHLSQTKPEYIDDIRQALTIFDQAWVTEKPFAGNHAKHARPGVKWSVYHHGLAEWITREVGHGAENKRLPREVFEWPVSAKLALLRTLVNGDGSRNQSGEACGYYTASAGLAEDVQLLCIHVGWSAALRQHGTQYVVGISTSRQVRRLFGRKTMRRQHSSELLASAADTGRHSGENWADVVPYDGLVWCVTVPNERFFSRRNGCVMLGGNTKSFYYNQARPDLLIWPKGSALRPAEQARLEEDWLNKSQGVFKAWKPYFLSREVEVKDLGTMGNFRSQQLVQLREYERSTIMQVFGIPPEILGNLEHSNRSTIDAAAYLMSRYVVEPRAEFLRNVMQERFVPEYDERLILQYASPVDDDHAAQTAAATAAPWALDLDEWRKLAGQKPMDDPGAGALHMVPSHVTLTAIEAPGGLPPPPPALTVPRAAARGGAPLGLPLARFPAREERHLLDAAGAAAEVGDLGLAETLQKATSLDVAALPGPSQVAARQEPALARALVRTWRDHATRLDLGQLTHALGTRGVPGDVVALLDPVGLGAAQSAVLAAQLTRGFGNGATVGATALRRQGIPVRLAGAAVEKPGPVAVDLAAVNAEATAWAQAHAGALVQAPADVRAIVAELTARANEEGIPPEDVARLLRDVVGLRPDQVTAVAQFQARLIEAGVADAVVASRTARYAAAQQAARALAIARTELISALNHGQQAVWQAAVAQQVIAPAQFEQVWLVTDDAALEEICEGLAETTAEIGGTFPGGYDSPPAHVNCRCAVGLQPVAAKALPRRPPIQRRRVERDANGFVTAIVDEEVAG